MDQSLWQTLSSFDFLHTSHEWSLIILLYDNTAQQYRFGFFKESDFAGVLEDSKSTSDAILYIFGSHTFVPISWMCKKPTSVSRCSTEAVVISLDTDLRMDGIPAFNLWHLEIEVFHSSLNQSIKLKDVRESRRNLLTTPQSHKWKQIQTTNTYLDLTNIDHVPSNGTHSDPILKERTLKITKSWSRLSFKAGVPIWDPFPKSTELILTVYLIKSSLIKSSTSNMWTSINKSLTCWPRILFRKNVGLNWLNCSL